MPQGARTDPLQVFNFHVEIEGVTVAGFTECSGLSSETEVIEYREGGDQRAGVRKIPGVTRYAPIVLKRGVTNNKELWNWRKAVTEGRIERRNGAIVLLDPGGDEVARWTFREGWPAKWEGPAFNAKASEVAIETLEIVHEGLELQ